MNKSLVYYYLYFSAGCLCDMIDECRLGTVLCMLVIFLSDAVSGPVSLQADINILDVNMVTFTNTIDINDVVL